jgi:hypothetical protein
MVVAEEAAAGWSSTSGRGLSPPSFLAMAKRYLQYVHALCSFPIKGTHVVLDLLEIDKRVIEDSY